MSPSDPSVGAVRGAVLAALHRVAPEADAAALRGDQPLREELELDSMDFLGFVIALHESLGVDVPEIDYPRLFTLDGAVRYLEGRLAAAPPAVSSTSMPS
jgi:acyl carrier protein